MAAKVMSKSDYAKYRGCSRITISRYLKSGKLSGSAVTSDGKIAVSEADRQLAERVAPIQQAASKSRFKKMAQETMSKAGLAGSGLSLSDSQALLAQYKAAIKKLEYEERTGKLVLAADVRQAAFDVARRVRDAMLNIPDRLAAILAAESNEAKIRLILAKEIREALMELAGVD